MAAAARGLHRSRLWACRVRLVERYGEQLAGARDIGGAVAIGKQTVVADAVEAVGQDVDEEAADELIGGKGHGFGARAAIGAIILVPEGDTVVVERDQPAVGDGDAVGVAEEIASTASGPPNGGFE